MSRARKGWLEWYRVDRDLMEHPKFHTLKGEWAVDRDIAAGRLIRFWSWVARHAPLGNLNAEALRTVEDHCGFSLQGLARAGFIDVLAEHEGLITKARAHHWYRMNGAQLRERWRKRAIGAEVPRNRRGSSTHTERDGTEIQKRSSASPDSVPVRAPQVMPTLGPTLGADIKQVLDRAAWLEAEKARQREAQEAWLEQQAKAQEAKP